MVSTSLLAQTEDSESFVIYEKMYREAARFQDLEAATNAIYGMMAANPEMVTLKDSLTLIYFARGMHMQSVLTGMEVLETNPSNNTIREVVTLSQESLGMVKAALDNYEQLFKNTGQLYYQYKVASIQYQMKRYGECSSNLNSLISNPQTAESNITISVPNGGQQTIPLSAGCLNLKGVMEMDLKQYDNAKASFEAALKAAPDFALAKNNLEAVMKLLDEEGDNQE